MEASPRQPPTPSVTDAAARAKMQAAGRRKLEEFRKHRTRLASARAAQGGAAEAEGPASKVPASPGMRSPARRMAEASRSAGEAMAGEAPPSGAASSSGRGAPSSPARRQVPTGSSTPIKRTASREPERGPPEPPSPSQPLPADHARLPDHDLEGMLLMQVQTLMREKTALLEENNRLKKDNEALEELVGYLTGGGEGMDGGEHMPQQLFQDSMQP